VRAVTTLASQQFVQVERTRRTSPVRQPVLRCADLGDPVVGLRNVCLLRLVERVGLQFAQAGMPLMVLKGAALNLTVHAHPDSRPMADIDLMVRPQDAAAALALLVRMGCRPGRPLVRSDFFPRFHYERDLLVPGVVPARIDLHVRPFRPLRYARTVPASAFWEGAEAVRIGRAEVLVPGAADMLLHLAVHSAVHDNAQSRWLADLRNWAQHCGDGLDWAVLLEHARSWGLMPAAHSALSAAEDQLGPIRPAWVRAEMDAYKPNWRERRTLRQAPRDAEGALGHVLTDALCAPGLRFKAAYLRAMLLPDRAHMGEWYDRRHPGWFAASRALRLLSPLLRHVPAIWGRVARTEIRETPRGPGVFARRLFVAGERVFAATPAAPGKLACVRHSCQPNARRDARGVVALKFIAPGEEVRVDHGLTACDCRRTGRAATDPTNANTDCHD